MNMVMCLRVWFEYISVPMGGVKCLSVKLAA